MSELFDAGELYEPEGEDNPFLGIDGFDEFTIEPDPFEQKEQEVLTTLSIESFGGLIVLEKDTDFANIRGNRFGDIREAILYLADSRLLGFGQVVLFENGEIGVAIGKSP